MPKIKKIDSATLKTWLDKGEAVLFDVREKAEFDSEHINGAILNPVSSFDESVVKKSKKKVVLQCLSGARSDKAYNACSGGKNVFCLEGGIDAWKKAGYGVEGSGAKVITLQQQVMIIAGFLVLLGTVLGSSVHPFYYALSAFVGAGLMFAGITGFCAMARLLSLMPWNK